MITTCKNTFTCKKTF